MELHTLTLAASSCAFLYRGMGRCCSIWESGEEIFSIFYSSVLCLLFHCRRWVLPSLARHGHIEALTVILQVVPLPLDSNNSSHIHSPNHSSLCNKNLSRNSTNRTNNRLVLRPLRPHLLVTTRISTSSPRCQVSEMLYWLPPLHPLWASNNIKHPISTVQESLLTTNLRQ